jgi:hypothetical protein
MVKSSPSFGTASFFYDAHYVPGSLTTANGVACYLMPVAGRRQPATSFDLGWEQGT